MIAQAKNKIAHFSRHPVVTELRLCLRRLSITWALHRLDAMERRAEADLAMDRASARRSQEAFDYLRKENHRRRINYLHQLQSLKEVAQ